MSSTKWRMNVVFKTETTCLKKKSIRLVHAASALCFGGKLRPGRIDTRRAGIKRCRFIFDARRPSSPFADKKLEISKMIFGTVQGIIRHSAFRHHNVCRKSRPLSELRSTFHLTAVRKEYNSNMSYQIVERGSPNTIDYKVYISKSMYRCQVFLLVKIVVFLVFDFSLPVAVGEWFSFFDGSRDPCWKVISTATLLDYLSADLINWFKRCCNLFDCVYLILFNAL